MRVRHQILERFPRAESKAVMAGLVPAIHAPLPFPPPLAGEGRVGADARHKAGHDADLDN
jgi:hypothetical protein